MSTPILFHPHTVTYTSPCVTALRQLKTSRESAWMYEMTARCSARKLLGDTSHSWPRPARYLDTDGNSPNSWWNGVMCASTAPAHTNRCRNQTGTGMAHRPR